MMMMMIIIIIIIITYLTANGLSPGGSGYYKGKGKVHPCTGAEALYRSYGT